MAETIRWGILGAGRVAAKFATDLARLPEATLVAIGSLSPERAESFAATHNVPRAYGSYAALVADAEVDVAYVATRNQAHFEASRLCLEAGKPVLCEKPFTLNARATEQLIALAHRQQCFLMEAMWTRFFPVMFRVREMLAAGRIGEPKLLMAAFGFLAEPDPQSRLFNPKLGGGALLDVGVYVASLASLVFGAPKRVSGIASIGPTGVDELSALTLSYDQGQIAHLSCGIRADMPKEAWIGGTEGHLIIQAPFWKPHTVTLNRCGKEPETIRHPYEGYGYYFEAAEVMNCLREGKVESPLMPLNESLEIMRTLDVLRSQWKTFSNPNAGS
jgi:predicted dehydrogenase